MTVAELIYALQQMPEDLTVVFPDYCKVTRVVRVVDPTLPKSIRETVVLTDYCEPEQVSFNKRRRIQWYGTL